MMFMDIGAQGMHERFREMPARKVVPLSIWVVVAGYLLQSQCARFARLPRNCAT